MYNRLGFVLMLILGCASAGLAMDNEDELDDFSLHFLYHKGDLERFRRAVERFNLDVDVPNEHGLSITHLAAMKGQITWIALLFSLGADFEEPDAKYEQPPIAWALYKGQIAAFRMLQNFGIPPVLPRFQKIK